MKRTFITNIWGRIRKNPNRE